ncbi:hypothetical protein JCM6882_009636 [Rhodosporidiobolus microsporus]
MPPRSTSKRKSTSAANDKAPKADEAEESPLTDQEASDADDKPKAKRAKKQKPAKEESDGGGEEEEDKPKPKKAKAKKGPVEPLDASLPTNLTVPDPLALFERPQEGRIRISAWNVAGLRASEKKGFSRYVEAEDADVLVVTETKTPEIALPALDSRYEHRFWGNHSKKGQAGTAIFSKTKPLNVIYGMHDGGEDVSKEESEGRCVTLEFDNTFVVGTYVPNAGSGLKNMDQKKAWNRAFERYLRELDAKKPVVWCGDLNVVATEKDIRNWKTNYNKSPGCTDDEIDGFSSQLNPPEDSGHKKLVDVWRHFNPDKEGHYTYQAYKFQCRSKGIGWRLDYFVTSERLMPKVKSCEMRHEIWGASDHLPLVLDIEGPL